MADIDPHRVAEVVVDVGGGPLRRGSGYLVRHGMVLTAAHVVARARSVWLRFDADQPGEWSASGDVVWCAGDLALLAIDPAGGEVPAARFGQVGDRAATLAVQAVGFPWFKLRTEGDAAYRDTHQMDGTVATLSNRREGTLEITVTPPGADPDPARSPWEGMSGAAVWCADRIIGVLAKHHRSDGLGRLAAVRLTEDVWTEMAAVLDTSTALSDVVPASEGERARQAHLLTVRHMVAPDRLLDRDRELAELARFCAGDETYLWWQAGPWAGKSALLSWFVLHPPPGVEVVSFFVTRRLPGESDSEAYLSALQPQLVPESEPGTSDRFRQLASWYESAATRAAEAGRVLVLVVDGLDEDTGTDSGLPSIASLLPHHVPANMRVVLASRPHPPLPVGVRGDHPLLTCRLRQLAPSPHARNLAREATHELVRVLRGQGRPIIGLLAASGGGLTHDDLAELTGQSRFDIAEQLAGTLGRSVSLADVGYVFSHDTLRATAEEQLGAEVAARRGELLAWADGYRQRQWPKDTPRYLLHAYPHMLAAADDLGELLSCAEDDRRHDRMRLDTGGDHLALTDLTLAHRLNIAQPCPDLAVAMRLAVRRADLAGRYNGMPACLPAVWELLGEHTRAEALARSVADTQPRALVELAQVVAAHQDPDRATALARLVPDHAERTAALAWLANHAGDHQQALALARSVNEYDVRSTLCTQLATEAEAAGDHERADAFTNDMQLYSFTQSDIVLDRARTAASRGDHDRAEALFWSVAEDAWVSNRRGPVLLDLVKAAAASGADDRVEALVAAAGRLQDDKATTLIADFLRGHTRTESRSGYAERLIDVVDRMSLAPIRTCRKRLAETAAAAGDYARAEKHCRLERHCHLRTDQSEAYALVAKQAIMAGHHERARRFAEQSQRALRSLDRSGPLDRIRPADLVVMAASAGHVERARSIVNAATSPADYIELRCALANGRARRGERVAAKSILQALGTVLGSRDTTSTAHHHAFQAALLTGEPDLARPAFQAISGVSYSTLSSAMIELVGIGDADPGLVDQMVCALPRPVDRAAAMVDLAQTVVHRDPPWAAALAREAYATLVALIRANFEPHNRLNHLSRILEASSCDPGNARSMISFVESAPPLDNPDLHWAFRTFLAGALAASGDYELAEATLRPDAEHEHLAQSFADLAEVAVCRGDLERARAYRDHALTLLDRLSSEDRRFPAISLLAEVTDRLGDHDEADAMAERLRWRTGQARVFVRLARLGADVRRRRRRLAEALWNDMSSGAVPLAVQLAPECLDVLFTSR